MNRNCSPYDSESYAVVAAVSAGLAFVSLVLIIGTIGIMILFKKLRFFSQRLILYLAISAILTNLAIILHRVDYQNQMSTFYARFCAFGGYFDLLSNWCLLLSVCAIITYTSLNLFLGKNTERYELIYIFFIFVFPLTFTWVPFIKSAYGKAGAWCWIRTEEQDDNCTRFEFGTQLQFSIWFVPLYFLMILLIILYLMILVKIYRKNRERLTMPDPIIIYQAKKIKKDLMPLIAYPLIYFLLNIFPFINRIHYRLSTEPSLALWYLAALANPSIGAWITLAFTLDPTTRKRLTPIKMGAAARELCPGDTSIEEYEFECDRERSIQRESKSHPYANYEKCYKLNLDQSSKGRTI